MANLKITSSILIVAGLLSFIVQILMLVYYKNAPVEYDMDKVNIGTGIWAGCFFAASGVAALLFTMGESFFKRVLLTALSGVSFFLSVVQIAIASVIVKDISGNKYERSTQPQFYDDHLIFSSCLVAAGVVSLIMTALQVKTSCSFFAQ